MYSRTHFADGRPVFAAHFIRHAERFQPNKAHAAERWHIKEHLLIVYETAWTSLPGDELLDVAEALLHRPAFKVPERTRGQVRFRQFTLPPKMLDALVERCLNEGVDEQIIRQKLGLSQAAINRINTRRAAA